MRRRLDAPLGELPSKPASLDLNDFARGTSVAFGAGMANHLVEDTSPDVFSRRPQESREPTFDCVLTHGISGARWWISIVRREMVSRHELLKRETLQHNELETLAHGVNGQSREPRGTTDVSR